MSKKSERFERLDQVCEELYEKFGEKFRVQQLATRARVSNSIAGPHKQYWLYRRAQHSLVSDLKARAEAPPQSDLAAVCEVASRANANVSALIDMVNKLIGVIGNGKEERYPREPKTTVSAERSSSDATSNLLRRGTRTRSHESRAGIPEVAKQSGRQASSTDAEVHDVIASIAADQSQDLAPGDNTEDNEVTLAPAEEIYTPTTSEEYLAPIDQTSGAAARLESERSPTVSLPTEDEDPPRADGSLDRSLVNCVDAEGAPVGSLLPPQSDRAATAVNAPNQIDFDFISSEVISSALPSGNCAGKRSTTPTETLPEATNADDGGSFDVNSFAFAEAVAEAVLLQKKRALTGAQIHSGLPPRVKGRYSEQHFCSLLRDSQRLHHNRSEGKFYAKFRGDGVSRSEGVALHLAATRAAANILKEIGGPLSSEAIHAKLPDDLQTRISADALASMLASGAAEDPVIKMTKLGGWCSVGSAAPPERRRDSRDQFPKFEAEVKAILRADNHPMIGVDIHDLLSPEQKEDFPRDKMYRHLQKVKGIFQYKQEDGPFLDKKWWLKAKRKVRHEAPVIDPDTSDRAAAMRYQDLITEEGESVVVANQPKEMNVASILVEVRKKFDVGDRTKFARALNSRRKAEKRRIERVREGVYRARRPEEY